MGLSHILNKLITDHAITTQAVCQISTILELYAVGTPRLLFSWLHEPFESRLENNHVR